MPSFQDTADYTNDCLSVLQDIISRDVAGTVACNPQAASGAQRFALQAWLGALTGAVITTAAVIEGSKNMEINGSAGTEISAVLRKYFPSLPVAEVVLAGGNEQN